ncbi:conserved hypothetical protein [Coccidioides posadasii str. Silveira]|uniref:Uncharacterized protein n=1 Tax=Coccidioides posadasii (strain RMSCC 757 / Silveira) TaxID=443226 RepID=E9D5Z4_COCPS|nr:conserved hypothetical protein [Coccidioides posadasii str. Silveira]
MYRATLGDHGSRAITNRLNRLIGVRWMRYIYRPQRPLFIQLLETTSHRKARKANLFGPTCIDPPGFEGNQTSKEKSRKENLSQCISKSRPLAFSFPPFSPHPPLSLRRPMWHRHRSPHTPGVSRSHATRTPRACTQ